MSEHVCEYCENILSSARRLDIHQKTAKYCLKLQGVDITLTKQYECPGCNKIYTRKDNLSNHTKKCMKYKLLEVTKAHEEEIKKLKSKYKRKIKRKDKQIAKINKIIMKNERELKQRDAEILKYRELYANNEGKVEVYKDVATKPRTVNRTVNNTVNQINPKLTNIPISNIQPFTIENVRKRIENGEYTYEMFIAGVQGITKFVSAMIIRDGVVEEVDGVENDGGDDADLPQERNYVCTDSSRNRFHRLLSSKDWKSDNGAHFLEKVLSELEPKAEEYYLHIIDMMTKAKTEDDREHMSKIQELTRDIYFGITRPNARERKQLFKKLRSEIKSIAAV